MGDVDERRARLTVSELPVLDTESPKRDERLREDDEQPDAAIPCHDARARLRREG